MRQTKNRKNKISRCSSVKGLRRLISVILLISLSLTGCKSILVNGNLSFKAYAPVQPMASALGIHQALLAEVDFQKYGIDGESAFWMPPYHLNPIYINYDMEEPTKNAMLADFKVLGYSEKTQRFVYAYLTPVFSKDNVTVDNVTGLTIQKSGKASDITVPEPGKEVDPKAGYVLVLMSYEPATKNYNIFYSNYYKHEYYSENQPTLMAGKVEGSDSYYIYDPMNTVVAIYNIDGTAVSSRSYLSEISTSLKELLVAPKTWWDWATNPQYYRYSVSDVQVDDTYCVYFSLQVEVSKKPFDDQSIADQIDENDEDDSYDEDSDGDGYEDVDEVVYYNAVVSAFSLPIGGPDPLIKFTSRITDDAKAKCEELANLDPIHIDVPDEIMIKARSKALYEEGSKALTDDSIVMKYLPEVSGYAEFVQKQKDRLTRNDKKALYDSYYGDVDDYLSSKEAYSYFDTAEMETGGTDVYFALSGIVDIDYIDIRTPDGDYQAGDPRTCDTAMSSSLYYTFDVKGNMYKTNLSLANSIVAQYVASRTYVPNSYYNAPLWVRRLLTPNYLNKYYSGTIKTMMDMGQLSGFFIKYGSDMLYPFLQPGDFSKTVSNDPEMRMINKSPYEVYVKKYADSSGFIKYTDSWDTYTGRLGGSLPLVMLFGGQQYSNGNTNIGYSSVVNNPYEYSSTKATYCLPKMVVDETMTLTLHQPIYAKYHSKSAYLGEVTTEVKIPTKYRMEFPGSCVATARGNTWVGEGVKSLHGLGCVTYKESSGIYKTANELPGIPYDDMSGKYGLPTNDSNDHYSWIQQMHQGSDGSLFDEAVPGVAKDVGAYIAADGTDEVIYITDENLRFYEKGENKKYKAYKDVSMDTIRRVSGYGLSIQDDARVDHETNQDKEKTKTDEMVDTAMEEDQQYSLLADNLLPYSKNKLMICHESDGISLYDLKGETMMKLMGGHYYRIYPMKDGKYMLIGFQTEQYDYTPGDLSMAKYYIIDLAKQINEEGTTNVDSYIDELRDMYHSLTHTVRYVGRDNNQNKVYEIVKPDADTDKEYARALKLFTGSDTDMQRI